MGISKDGDKVMFEDILKNELCEHCNGKVWGCPQTPKDIEYCEDLSKKGYHRNWPDPNLKFFEVSVANA